jgi:hypothetical protein
MGPGPHLHEEGVPCHDKGTAKNFRIWQQIEVTSAWLLPPLPPNLGRCHCMADFPSREALRSTCCTPSDSHEFLRD